MSTHSLNECLTDIVFIRNYITFCVVVKNSFNIVFICVWDRPHMLVMLADDVLPFFFVVVVSFTWTNWTEMLRHHIHFLIVWSRPLFWDYEQKSVWHLLISYMKHCLSFLYNTFSDETCVFGKKNDSVYDYPVSDEETFLKPHWNDCNLHLRLINLTNMSLHINMGHKWAISNCSMD